VGMVLLQCCSFYFRIFCGFSRLEMCWQRFEQDSKRRVE
jgi:hypothetical protein